MMMRILSRLNQNVPAGVVRPTEVISLEAGTLSSKVEEEEEEENLCDLC